MIFLDTGYFKGLMDKKDEHNEESEEIKEYLKKSKETTVINTTVLVETLNRFKGSTEDINKLYDNLYDKNTVIPLNDEDYKKSLKINGWFGNSINYSDCTIIKTMMDLVITRIVSFDGGFKKVGNYEVVSSVGVL